MYNYKLYNIEKGSVIKTLPFFFVYPFKSFSKNIKDFFEKMKNFLEKLLMCIIHCLSMFGEP